MKHFAWEDAILLVRKSWVMSMVSMVMKVMSMVTKVTATAIALPSMVSEFGGLDACQHGVFLGHRSFPSLVGQAMVIVIARFGTFGPENDQILWPVASHCIESLRTVF